MSMGMVLEGLAEDDRCDEDMRWTDYVAVAESLDRSLVLSLVLDYLLEEDGNPLRDLIDRACRDPHREPWRPRENAAELQAMGQYVLDRVALTVDHLVTLRQAVQRAD